MSVSNPSRSRDDNSDRYYYDSDALSHDTGRKPRPEKHENCREGSTCQAIEKEYGGFGWTEGVTLAVIGAISLWNFDKAFDKHRERSERKEKEEEEAKKRRDRRGTWSTERGRHDRHSSAMRGGDSREHRERRPERRRESMPPDGYRRNEAGGGYHRSRGEHRRDSERERDMYRDLERDRRRSSRYYDEEPLRPRRTMSPGRY